MKRNISLKTQEGGPDKLLIVLPIILTVLGVIMVTNVSVIQAQSLFGDKFFFAKQQLLWAIIGILGFMFAKKIPYHVWNKIATPIFLVTIILLVGVLFPGIGVQALGARRWIETGFFNFQPAELAKLATILWCSKMLTKNSNLAIFFLGVLTVAGLVIAQPDLGTSIIIGILAIVLLFVSGVPLTFFLAALPLIALTLFLLISLSPYRKERFLGFLAGISDPLLASYHVKQVIFAIASGGLLGVGLGQSRQKFLFLPEATTDSIFAIIAEEVGFVGSFLLIAVFGVLVWKILSIATRVDDPFAKLVTTGVGVWIGTQVFINIGGLLAALPLTGIPLPFFSYGGSSLVVTLFALGIVVNISTKRRVAK